VITLICSLINLRAICRACVSRCLPFRSRFISFNRELGDFRAAGVQFERYEQRISRTNEKETPRKKEREREREGEGEGEGKRTLFRVKLNLVIISHKYTRINIGLTRIATIIRYANINHYETCTAERNKSRVHRIIPLRRGNYRGREFRRDTPIKTHHGLFPGICIMRK